MDDQYKVQLISDQHIPLLGTDLKTHPIRRVSIAIGSFGPYTKDFPEGQDDVETIKAWMAQKQNELRLLNS